MFRILEYLPRLKGGDISLAFKPRLSAYRGKLISGFPERGNPVYAAAFVRRRQIILETTLLRNAGRLRLILIHELFHFVWARLGNVLRADFATLLLAEANRGAKGELGESAGVKKAVLQLNETKWQESLWRDYVCESFCDTAAWLYSGMRTHPEFLLAKRWREIRKRWFLATFDQPRGC